MSNIKLPTKEEMIEANAYHSPVIIITEIGTYLTRSGKTVEINEIGDPAKSSFNCKGYLITKKGKKVRRTWNIWAPNGAFCGLGKLPDDIVSKITGDTPGYTS